MGNTFGVFTIHLDVPWESTATHPIPSKNWLHPFRYFIPKYSYLSQRTMYSYLHCSIVLASFTLVLPS